MNRADSFSFDMPFKRRLVLDSVALHSIDVCLALRSLTLAWALVQQNIVQAVQGLRVSLSNRAWLVSRTPRM